MFHNSFNRAIQSLSGDIFHTASQSQQVASCNKEIRIIHCVPIQLIELA